ncbi:hypothetical protein ORI20_10375 [Mycobacterium sp. CVI_P3]|uniref:CAP domain-containing protein n=1 Tax=Mycobacterium pinniadriaticum TaxID=2994102 RepID=A0ABT3SD85_9MYCO|nr:hypothetical protein [Mycobacterium pinniadriaticum]MCX2930684.1 hypothetical protein [Mycobacterium pinniadriaticum]MCX2937108.1 hypothetical protein [Mycobacterium pinniadriaticum]
MLVIASPSLPSSRADPSTTLTQATVAARAASNCPPLQWNPLVERGAAMANLASAGYISHRSAAVPFTDPLPALATIGYAGSKGLMLSGYGATEAEALQAVLLQYQAFKPDCAYSQFGTDLSRTDKGSVLASVILTVPAAQP